MYIDFKLYSDRESLNVYMYERFKPFSKSFVREINDDDLQKLTQIPMIRITRFDSDKADDAIAKLETEIEQVKQLDQWVALSGKLQIIGVPSVVGIYVDADDKNSAMNAVKMVQGGLSLGEKSYYSGTDERMKSIRNEFVKHVDNLMKLSGKSQTNIGKSLLDFETKLAAIQFSNVELRDPLKTYNKVALKDLQKQSKNIDWVNFVE